jgi:hypothetical protein
MSLYEDTNPHELKELLGQIDKGDAVLPDFQRDFVWDPNATMELIISIAQSYPAGSLLRIRNTHNLFAYREFEGSPPINGRRPTFLILDGQQRLTSLYQAFFGKGENRYFIDLNKMVNGLDFEDCIFNLKSNHSRISEYDQLEHQSKELIMPLSILKGGSGEYSRWVRKISRMQPDEVGRIKLEDQLDEIDTWIQAIDDYKFPVVTLTDETKAEAVCTIFETLNRTGVKLSPFELLTARFWHQGLNLRQLWSEARETYPILEDFLVDPYYVLQIISLVAKAKPSCKRSDVMALEKEAIEKNWKACSEGLVKALTFLRSQCGVLTPGLLPYFTILIPLAATYASLMDYKGPKVGVIDDRVGRWFWCSVFGQRYESAPNSQAATDYSDVIGWVKDGKIPETIATFRFDPALLRDTTVRQRAIYRGTLALVFRNQSRDFHSHKPLTQEVISENHIDDHHIFPDKYLDQRNIPPRQRDCVLNHTYIDRETNQRINARPPSDYMNEIQEARGDEKFHELLNSHLLPIGPQASIFTNDDFYAFIEWRQQKIFEEIKKVTGLQ